MREVIYKQTEQGDLKLRIYEPADDGKDRPGVVFYFGGGWAKGTLNQFKAHSEHLARFGMVAVCAEYRLKSLHGTTPYESTLDGRSAFRWVRSNADELGIDTDRLAAGGGSAGGQVALAVALAEGENDESDDSSIPCDPSLLLLFNPACDMVQRSEKFENAEQARTVSPLHLINDRIPPSIQFFGTADKILDEGKLVQERSRALGVDAELYLAEGEKHAFFNRSPWKETCIDLMHEYLSKHGYVSGESGIEVEAKMSELATI